MTTACRTLVAMASGNDFREVWICIGDGQKVGCPADAVSCGEAFTLCAVYVCSMCTKQEDQERT